MGLEIDFLPVGDGSKGGDAIALRYGNLHGPRQEQTVVVVDGGYTDDGIALVDHIKNHYNTEYVDMVFSTHPDRDHVKGLEIVLEELEVGKLYMHKPDDHDTSLQLIGNSTIHTLMANQNLVKSLTDTRNLLDIARKRNVPVEEPYAGMATSDGCLCVVGPTREYYEEKLREMQGKTSATQTSSISVNSLLGQLAKSAVNSETLLIETLTDKSEVTASNNSSVILLLNVDGRLGLLTADAGAEALHHAVDLLEAAAIPLGTFKFVQVPHHGSRHNVTPILLDRILGPKGQANRGSAYVSSPPKNPEMKHPAKVTSNAFHRRGYRVYSTSGKALRHHHNAPDREGWGTATPHPFYDQVENHDD